MAYEKNQVDSIPHVSGSDSCFTCHDCDFSSRNLKHHPQSASRTRETTLQPQGLLLPRARLKKFSEESFRSDAFTFDFACHLVFRPPVSIQVYGLS